MVLDGHVSDLLPECRGTRSLFRLGNDRQRDLGPVTLTTNVLAFHTELVFKALNQACDFIAGLCKCLCGYRHPFVLLLLTFLKVVAGDFRSSITSWRFPADNTGVFGSTDNERLLRDSRFIYKTKNKTKTVFLILLAAIFPQN